MGTHTTRIKDDKKRHRRGYHDNVQESRIERVTFKRFVQNLEEELLETDIEEDEDEDSKR